MTAALAGLVLLGMTSTAEAIPVDLELSLVVDSSGSINTSEFSQQVDGYANAFRQAAVVDSIVNAPNGIAVNTILFATSATEVIPFTQLQTATDVDNFATALESIARIDGGTNIPSGINLAVETIATNNFESGNIIIDVSGDGTSSPASTQASRDAALTAGVSRINGLAIGGTGILNFYENNVIGGLNAFALQATSFDEFGQAIAQKIQVEVGAPDPDPDPDPDQDPEQVAAPGAIGLIGFGVFALGWVMRRRPRA
jgi:hypothetical protein